MIQPPETLDEDAIRRDDAVLTWDALVDVGQWRIAQGRMIPDIVTELVNRAPIFNIVVSNPSLFYLAGERFDTPYGVARSVIAEALTEVLVRDKIDMLRDWLGTYNEADPESSGFGAFFDIVVNGDFDDVIADHDGDMEVTFVTGETWIVHPDGFIDEQETT